MLVTPNLLGKVLAHFFAEDPVGNGGTLHHLSPEVLVHEHDEHLLVSLPRVMELTEHQHLSLLTADYQIFKHLNSQQDTKFSIFASLEDHIYQLRTWRGLNLYYTSCRNHDNKKCSR